MTTFSQSSIKTNLQNLGNKSAAAELRGVVSSISIAPIDSEFADCDTAVLKASWDTLLKQAVDRLYKLPLNREGESINDEATFFEYVTSGGAVKTKSGRLKFTQKFHVPFKLVKALMKADGYYCRVFVNYENNYIVGASEDGTKFQGFKATIYLENPNWNMDATPEMVMLRVEFEDSMEDFWEYAQYIIPSDFQVENLDSLTNLDLALSNLTATTATLTVTNTYTGDAFAGLLEADYSLTGTGTISSMTDNEDGTYDFVTVGQVDGDVWDLVSAATLSVEYYESGGSQIASGI